MQADVRDKARELSALEGLVMRYQSELSNLAMQASSREADGEELVASVGKRGCVEVWENQRFYHVMGWSTQLLATDRYAREGAPPLPPCPRTLPVAHACCHTLQACVQRSHRGGAAGQGRGCCTSCRHPMAVRLASEPPGGRACGCTGLDVRFRLSEAGEPSRMPSVRAWSPLLHGLD